MSCAVSYRESRSWDSYTLELLSTYQERCSRTDELVLRHLLSESPPQTPLELARRINRETGSRLNQRIVMRSVQRIHADVCRGEP
jgi:hypothetical protein